MTRRGMGAGGGGSAPVTYSTGRDEDRPAASAALFARNYLYAATADTGIRYQCTGASTWSVLSAGAGLGADKCTLGGWTAASVYISRLGAAVGPQWAVGGGYTLAAGIHRLSSPGTTGGLIASYADAGLVGGWQFGSSSSVSNTLMIYLAGVNGTTEINLPGAVISAGTAHSIAISYKTGGLSVHYAWDGVIQTPVAVSGTYNPPGNVPFAIGEWVAGTNGFTWGELAWLRGYAADLSDADLVLLSGAASTYRPGATANNYTYDIRAASLPEGVYTFRPTGTESATLQATGPASITKNTR